MLSTAAALLFSLSLASSSPTSHLSPRQAVTPPPECDVIPVWEVTSFQWFNSSHNLDCVNQVDVRESLPKTPRPPPPQILPSAQEFFSVSAGSQKC